MGEPFPDPLLHRLVSGTPERLSLPVLAALCDIFGTTPSDFIATSAEVLAPRRVAAAGETVGNRDAIRPVRAILRPAP